MPTSTASPEYIDLVLPNLFDIYALTSSVNPHYKEVRAESAAWVGSFEFFDTQAHKRFIRFDFELLAAFTYPKANREDYRTICDYMNSLFVFDDISDELDESNALITACTYLKALAGEECEQSDTQFYKFVSELAQRIRKKNLPCFQWRLMQSHGSYVRGVVEEAKHRANGIVPNLDEYIVFRRDTAGVRPVFDMMGFALDIDLPDEVFTDDAFQNASNAAIDMIALANDLHSYKKEHAADKYHHNVLNILMRTKDMSLQEAANYVGALSESRMKDYLKYKSLVRSFGPEIDADVQAYLRNMDDWVVGNIEWNFLSKRYFGDEDDKVRESQVVRITLRAP